MLVDKWLYGEPRDPAETKELKVRVPLAYHIKLHGLKLLNNQSISQSVTKALELYFKRHASDAAAVERGGSQAGPPRPRAVLWPTRAHEVLAQHESGAVVLRRDVVIAKVDPNSVSDSLRKCRDRGWLERRGLGKHRITKLGREELKRVRRGLG